MPVEAVVAMPTAMPVEGVMTTAVPVESVNVSAIMMETMVMTTETLVETAVTVQPVPFVHALGSPMKAPAGSLADTMEQQATEKQFLGTDHLDELIEAVTKVKRKPYGSSEEADGLARNLISAIWECAPNRDWGSSKGNHVFLDPDYGRYFSEFEHALLAGADFDADFERDTRGFSYGRLSALGIAAQSGSLACGSYRRAEDGRGWATVRRRDKMPYASATVPLTCHTRDGKWHTANEGIIEGRGLSLDVLKVLIGVGANLEVIACSVWISNGDCSPALTPACGCAMRPYSERVCHAPVF